MSKPEYNLELWELDEISDSKGIHYKISSASGIPIAQTLGSIKPTRQ